MRLGSWQYLKWKHAVPIKRNNVIVGAKIIVYAGEKEQYFSFITPEAYNALNWMDFRNSFDENITGESIVMRDKWQKINRYAQRAGKAERPIPLSINDIKAIVYRA